MIIACMFVIITLRYVLKFIEREIFREIELLYRIINLISHLPNISQANTKFSRDFSWPNTR